MYSSYFRSSYFRLHHRYTPLGALKPVCCFDVDAKKVISGGADNLIKVCLLLSMPLDASSLCLPSTNIGAHNLIKVWQIKKVMADASAVADAKGEMGGDAPGGGGGGGDGGSGDGGEYVQENRYVSVCPQLFALN